MAAKRQKPNNLIHLPDIHAVDGALSELCELTRSIESTEAAMNAEIDSLKAKAAAEIQPAQARKGALEAGLEAFGKYNKTMFDHIRSKELVYGTIGFRKSRQLRPMPKKTWAKVLGLIKQYGHDTAIRKKEKPNKEVLEQWPDERLKSVGVRWFEKDEFWYELKEETLEN